MKNMSDLAKKLNLGPVVERGGIPKMVSSSDDDINLSSIRQTGLDYSDFDGNQINDGASNAR